MEATEEQQVSSFNSTTYLMTLASGLGIGVSDIPQEVRTQALGLDSPRDINPVIMNWYRARTEVPVTAISDQDKEFFKTLVTPENSARARELRAQIDRNLQEATSNFTSGQRYLTDA